MRIFVTGANGYLGRNFIKKAIKQNYKIFALTRKKNNKKIKNVKWLVGSIDKEWKELSRSDILIHFAAVGVNKKFASLKRCFDFNVLKSTNLILNALKANCLNWIIITSNKEQKIDKIKINKETIKKNMKTPYFNHALTKSIFSRICLTFTNNKIKCRIIKLFHVYGGDERKTRLWPSLIKSAKNNKDFKMTPGKQIYDFNHIEDIVDGLLDAINFNRKSKYFPQTWDMASGNAMSVKSFAKKIWKKYNPKSRLIFSKIKVYDRESYTVNKKVFWKIKCRKP